MGDVVTSKLAEDELAATALVAATCCGARTRSRLEEEELAATALVASTCCGARTVV